MLYKALFFRILPCTAMLVISACGVPRYEVRYPASRGACFDYERKYPELRVVSYDETSHECLLETKVKD